MKLFQWFAMACYWQYVSLSIARGIFDTSDPSSAAFREAMLVNGQAGAFSNAIACVAALAMVSITRRMGAKPVHASCLVLGGLGMWLVSTATSTAQLYLGMAGIGLAWGSIMGNSYVLLASSIPPARTGVYMGIFNMMIVIPMLIQSLVLSLTFKPLLGSDPRNVLLLAGALMVCGALATWWVRVPDSGADDSRALT